jgi:elongation factor Ts
MAQVNMQQVKELRDRTQAGLNDCRSALVESEGDMDKAVEIILKKGLAKSAKRAGAVAAEGVVITRVAADGLSGVIVEVNIQTDFAARNLDFLKFAEGVADVAAKADAGADLSALPFPGASGSVEDTRAALVGKLGENISVRRWQRLSVGAPGQVHSYVHLGGKIGVLLAVKAGSDAVVKHEAFKKFVDDTAMQIAAMNPMFLNAAAVPETDKAAQREIFAGQLKEEGKVPEDKWPRVVEGKVAKWMKEVCLIEQPSVLETDKSVDQVRAGVAKAAGGEVSLVQYVRFECGEGVEKPQAQNFADEVAKMAGG